MDDADVWHERKNERMNEICRSFQSLVQSKSRLRYRTVGTGTYLPSTVMSTGIEVSLHFSAI
jgi:hypothetical protein